MYYMILDSLFSWKLYTLYICKIFEHLLIFYDIYRNTFIVTNLETFIFFFRSKNVCRFYVNVKYLLVYKKRGETLLFSLGSFENVSIFPFFFFFLLADVSNLIFDIIVTKRWMDVGSVCLQVKYCTINNVLWHVRYDIVSIELTNGVPIVRINVIIHRPFLFYNTCHPTFLQECINVL